MAKKVTISDIAKALKISPTTVSFVLNNHQDKGISEDTRQRVIEKAAQMGYQKLFKPSLEGWTRVAYLVPNTFNFSYFTSFFAGVYSHLQQQAMDHKMEVFLYEFDVSKDKSQVYKRYQEILSLGFSSFITNSGPITDFLLEQNANVVFFQGGSVRRDCVTIHCDDYNAGQIAADYAWDMGHRKAGMIFPEPFMSHRYGGFYDTFTAKGGVISDKHIWLLDLNHDRLLEQIRERSTKLKLPSLFFCFADNVLFPAIRAFKLIGIQVPDDVSLIGADNLYWGRYNCPAFTTVDLSEEFFAQKVIEGIKHVLNDGPPYVLAVPVKLVERETVKRI